MIDPNNLFEYRGNIHNHTMHSDGYGTVPELVDAANKTGLNFLILNDHNILLDQADEGWQQDVLLLLDIEVNDENRDPKCNHLLTLNVHEDVTPFAADQQTLIDAVRDRGGLTFLAHPFDKPSPLIPGCYPWLDWDIEGFTGLEIWNLMAEFRPFATSKPKALLVGFFPQYFTTGPYPETLAKWDALLQQHPTPAIGGPDAHALEFYFGPVKRTFLSYDYCYRAINTHIITGESFSGEVDHDRALVYDALGAGQSWIGYDMIHSSDGFRFTASDGQSPQTIGASLSLQDAVQFQVETPADCHIKLVRAGTGVVAETQGTSLTYTANQPGAYRIEAWKKWWFKPRGWIFSNPIYVT